MTNCLDSQPFTYGHRIVAVLSIFTATCVLSWMTACRPGKTPSPTISFNKIPPAAHGGRERVDIISGTVTGATTTEKIVVYARSGPWWVQPWPDHPLIAIQKDFSWKTDTHLGYEYAALLVRPDYKPAATLDSSPELGGDVLATKIAKGVGSLPPPPTIPIRFAGYNWNVDTSSAVRGGFNHLFSPDNVSVDKAGALHLRMQQSEKGWLCAHLSLAESLGYGTYTFQVRNASHLSPASILSFDTFDEWASDQHYREMDIELGRWGDLATKANSQVGIQPFYVPGNIIQVQDPPGRLTHALQWRPGVAVFEAYRSQSQSSIRSPIYRHIFLNGVPSPGQELAEFMFYRVDNDPKQVNETSEIVIEQFSFVP